MRRIFNIGLYSAAFSGLNVFVGYLSVIAIFSSELSQIAKDVTGQEHTPIYIGGDFNDVVISDLPKYKEDGNLTNLVLDLGIGEALVFAKKQYVPPKIEIQNQI